MTWFDKLKDIIKIEIKELIKININTVNNPDPEVNHTLSADKKTLTINATKVEAEGKKKELFEALKEGVEQDDLLLIESKAECRIKDIRAKLKEGDIGTILKFYKDKIDENHWKALQASLYVRKVFEKREGSIDYLKKDLIKRFGDEGRIICNLCTSGYFDKDGYITQLYTEMSASSDFEPAKFGEEFKKIVTLSPFAEFVHKDMSEEELAGEINQKLSTYQKYGIRFLAIHGIGKQNVEKIRKIVDELEKQNPDLKPKIAQEENIIQVTIYFKIKIDIKK